jgi:flagellar hook-length control protein FliK
MTISPITPQLDVSSRSGSSDTGAGGAKTSGFADILDAAQQRVNGDDDRDPNVDAANDGTDASNADATDGPAASDGTGGTDETGGPDQADDTDDTATPDEPATALLQATVATNELLQPDVASATEVATPVTNGDVTAALDANKAGAGAVVGAIGEPAAAGTGATAATGTAKATVHAVAEDGPGTAKDGNVTTGTTETPAPVDGPAPSDPTPTDPPTDPTPTDPPTDPPVAEVPADPPPAEPVVPPVDETTNTLADVAEALATLDSVAPSSSTDTPLAPRAAPTVDTTSALSSTSIISPTIHTTTPSPVASATPVAASSTPPAVPAAPHEQVVAVLAPMQHQNDGVYRLRLELHPAELGRVEIDVELRNGVLHANLRADQAAAAHVLRDAISDLKVRLEAQGVRAGDVTVDGRGPNAGGRERSAGGPGSARGGANNGHADDTNADDDPRQRQQPVELTESVLDLRM